MSSKNKIALLFTFLSIFVLSGVTAQAQVVDPCWYGCPKDGCPECDTGGGPITGRNGKERVKACMKNHKARVADCAKYYPPRKDSVKHRECLAKEKTMFNACKKAR